MTLILAEGDAFEPDVLQGVRVRKLDGASTWTWEYLQ